MLILHAPSHHRFADRRQVILLGLRLCVSLAQSELSEAEF